MDEVSETELFSAYLDGELTADEQVRVEQILATSSVARQLMEELRALENTLQGLPVEELDEDLSPRVLEVAERRMLLPADAPDEPSAKYSADPSAKPSAGRAAESLVAPENDSADWLGIPWREISWRGMLSKRALIWSGIVVATAVIISFTSPSSPPKPNLEIAKSDEKPAAPSAAGERLREHSKSERSWNAPAEPSGSVRWDEGMVREESKKADGEARIADRKGLKDQVARRAPGGLDELEGVRRQDELGWADRPGERSKSADKADKGVLRDGSGSRAKSAAGKPASDEVAKATPTSKDSGSVRSLASEKKAADFEVKKDAPSSAAMAADARPAPTAAPMPAPATPPTPSPPAIAAKPAAEPPPPAVAMDSAPAALNAPKTPNAPQLLGTNGAAGAQPGQGKGGFGPAETANQSVSRGGGTALMNGTGFANNSVPYFSDTATSNFQAVQVAGKRAGGQETPPATVVRFDVSTRAVQNKVFERLLTDNGLVAGQNATNYANYAYKSEGNRQYRYEGNFQAPAATANPQLATAGKAPPEKPDDQPDNTKSLKQQLPEGLSQDNSPQVIQKKETQGVSSASSQAIIFECVASSQQLDGVITQIRGDKSGVFSAPKIETGTSVLPVVGSVAQNNSYASNSVSRGYGGGAAYRPLEQQQAKAPAGGAFLAGRAAEQPQAAQSQSAPAPVPASQQVASPGAMGQAFPPGRSPRMASQTASPAGGAAMQHVFFVLNVVDRVAPAANRASQAPAAAAPAAPAKQ